MSKNRVSNPCPYAWLIKDLVTSKVMMEVATYKQKEVFGEINAEDFNVTTMDLGAISRDTGNHFFNFSVDHMLNESKRDNKEKKDLKKLIITMVEYIESLMNFSALPLIQTPQYFYLKSSNSQQLVRKMQKEVTLRGNE